MRKRDWAGTVLVACLIAAAGLLRDHTVLLLLLGATALICIAVILWDTRRSIEAGVRHLGIFSSIPSSEKMNGAKEPAARPQPIVTADGLLEELLAEGEAMLEDSNVFNAVTGRQSQYGRATPSKVENWIRRVLQGLPEAHRDGFQFPGPESVEERIFNGLKHGPEATEIRRLRRHVEALKCLMRDGEGTR